jgi:hypothetical protein
MIPSPIKHVMSITLALREIEIYGNTTFDHGSLKIHNMTCKENSLPDWKTKNLERVQGIAQHSVRKWL